MRQPIGQVTPEECRAIYRLHERLSSLRELLLSLDPEADAALVGRVEADQDATRARFDAWWADMAATRHFSAPCKSEYCQRFLLLSGQLSTLLCFLLPPAWPEYLAQKAYNEADF